MVVLALIALSIILTIDFVKRRSVNIGLSVLFGIILVTTISTIVAVFVARLLSKFPRYALPKGEASTATEEDRD